MHSERQKGFTLLELLITVSVLAIILSIAVPSMREAAERRRTIAAAEDIYSQLQFARSHAIARSEPVFMNIADGANWAIGISDNTACDPSDNNPACTLPDMEDSNPVTHRFTFDGHQDVRIDSSSGQIAFRSQRGTATSATIDVTSTGDVGYIMTVNVGLLGQISLCSPNADASKYLSGYRPCS